MWQGLVRVGICACLVALTGCEPSWRGRFKEGTKLYDKNGHRYFGKVVGYDVAHDFRNGTAPQPAILIEPVEGGEAARIWGACRTCAETFDVE